MNTNMPPFEDPSDARLHAALRDLPDHRAPDSLLPNVLAAIRAREQAAAALARTPWFRRPATRWPAAFRIALGSVALGLITLIALAPQAIGWAGPTGALRGSIMGFWSKIEALLDAVLALGSGCLIALRDAAGTPVLLGGAAVILFSYFALLGIGGAVWRTASQARQS